MFSCSFFFAYPIQFSSRAGLTRRFTSRVDTFRSVSRTVSLVSLWFISMAVCPVSVGIVMWCFAPGSSLKSQVFAPSYLPIG
jgi:hypothetical protein